MIGYPSGQNGAILPTRDYCVSHKEIVFFFHIKYILLDVLVFTIAVYFYEFLPYFDEPVGLVN